MAKHWLLPGKPERLEALNIWRQKRGSPCVYFVHPDLLIAKAMLVRSPDDRPTHLAQSMHTQRKLTLIVLVAICKTVFAGCHILQREHRVFELTVVVLQVGGEAFRYCVLQVRT